MARTRGCGAAMPRNRRSSVIAFPTASREVQADRLAAKAKRLVQNQPYMAGVIEHRIDGALRSSEAALPLAAPPAPSQDRRTLNMRIEHLHRKINALSMHAPSALWVLEKAADAVLQRRLLRATPNR